MLAIGHGLYNRVIRATLAGVTIRDIPRMTNGEVTVLHVTNTRHHRSAETPPTQSVPANHSDQSDRSDA